MVWRQMTTMCGECNGEAEEQQQRRCDEDGGWDGDELREWGWLKKWRHEDAAVSKCAAKMELCTVKGRRMIAVCGEWKHGGAAGRCATRTEGVMNFI